MSDGMSDSRPFQTEWETWDEVDGVKLKKKIDVAFFHFRDGVQAECYQLNIAFFKSRWDVVRITGGLGGEDAIAFLPNESQGTAKELMKKAILQQLKKERYKKYALPSEKSGR